MKTGALKMMSCLAGSPPEVLAGKMGEKCWEAVLEVCPNIQFDVLEAIKHLAKEDNRSINSEIIWILRTYIASRQRKETHATNNQDQA